jgi:hypothetical protein
MNVAARTLTVLAVAGAGCAPLGRAPQPQPKLADALTHAQEYDALTPLAAPERYLNNPASAGFRIPPGAELEIRHLQLRPDGSNEAIPVLVETRWTRPHPGSYRREDFHFVRWLWSASAQRSTVGLTEVAWLDSHRSSVAASTPEAFTEELARRALEPLFASLSVTRGGGATGGASQADQYRNGLCFGDANSYRIDNTQTMSATATATDGATTELTFVGEKSRWFFNNPVERAQANSPWAEPGKGFIGHNAMSLNVPVSFQGVRESRMVPACWTVADLEREYDVEVAGIFRRAAYLPAREEGAAYTMPDRARLGWREGRFPVWFGRRWPRDDHLRLADADKRAVLVAPGDVVVLRRRGRGR